MGSSEETIDGKAMNNFICVCSWHVHFVVDAFVTCLLLFHITSSTFFLHFILPSSPLTPSPSQGISSSDLSQSNIAADRQLRDKSKERSDKERRHRERRKEKEVRGSEQAGQGEVDPGGGEESAGQEGEVRRGRWSNPCRMALRVWWCTWYHVCVVKVSWEYKLQGK